MAASILKLLTGVVEYFVAKKPPTEIAKILGVEYPELRLALHQTVDHTWRGKLIRALANPEFRPDLVPYVTHLARLEEQYGILMNQRRSAESICLEYRSQPHPVALQLILKAEMFANRVQSQCIRVLASIQKTELLLAKAEKNQPGVEEQPKKEAKTASQATPEVAQEPEPIREAAEQQAPAEPTAHLDPTPPAPATDHRPLATPEPATSHQPPATDFPTPEEFKLLVFKHRHRIKDTRAEDRPALIARLIEQDRKQKQSQPAPNQNGKQAA